MARYRLGCCGWAYPEWVGRFYAPGTPARNYLRYYARVFDTVEANVTFYHWPEAKTSREWAQATPADFTFSAKLTREFTHDGGLARPEENVPKFLEGLEPLRRAGKLGLIVAQLPSTFQRGHGERALAAFLAAWPRDVGLAVELRHQSWWVDETYELLRRHGASLVWNLIEGEGDPAPSVRTTDWVYVRAIGSHEEKAIGVVRQDRSTDMGSLRDRLAREAEDAQSVTVVVNNHFTGYAPDAARRLAEILHLRPLDLDRAWGGQRGLAQFD